MFDRLQDILAADPASPAEGTEIGRSRDGRAIPAFRFGRGPKRISLIGGSHADEPVGPRFLGLLVSFLSSLPTSDPMLEGCEWWIIPHMNPDGAERNRRWSADVDGEYDVGRYLNSVVREAPGDDIEFGYPRDEHDSEARLENRAAWTWWRSAAGPFHVHVSLHGMGFAAGPWFLIEPEWADRCNIVIERCRASTAALGYVLHDVERQGEKGFVRIERGFCTRPDSRRMREHFLNLGDEKTASRFRPSSMEVVRSLGGDTLTMVTEMPLFLTPGVGEDIGPPDPDLERWRNRILGWRESLADGADPAAVSRDARDAGLKPMPIRDQMELQWRMITAGIEQVEAR